MKCSPSPPHRCLKSLHPLKVVLGLAVSLLAAQSTGSCQNNTLLRRIADLNPGSGGSFASNLTVFAGTLCFSAYTAATGRELWVYDGRTVALASNINDTVTDIGGGTLVGSDSDPQYLTTFNGKLYFCAFDPRRGGELWQWDGANAARVADINPDVDDSIKPDPLSSWPAELTPLGDRLWFSANGPGTSPNCEPWSFDGTSTLLVTNIHPDSGSDFSSYPKGLVAFNGSLYFMADDGVTGWELWRLEGPNASRFDINPGNATSSSFPKYFTPLGGKLYFQALNDSSGFELWETDGTNVALVADIHPGKSDSNPEHLTVFQGALYFSANDGVNGVELWKYPPGDQPTLVSNINANADSYPKNLKVFSNELCFAANDGIHGWELWSWNGSSARLVTDLNTNGDSFPEALTVFNGALYFVATTPETGYELWKYDGANVTLAADLNPGPGSSYPENLAVFNNELCFSAAADGVSDWELWSLSVSNAPPEPILLQAPVLSGTLFSFAFNTEAGLIYDVQVAAAPPDSTWSWASTVIGTGSPVTFTDAFRPASPTFYRVQLRSFQPQLFPGRFP